MDIQSQKLELIEWLASLKDQKVIKQFLALKNTAETENDIALQKTLEKGQAEINSGKGRGHQEVKKHYSKWL